MMTDIPGSLQLDTPDDHDNPDRIIELLQGYLDKRTTSQLELSRRVDFLVTELGGVRELAHKVTSIDEQLQKISLTQQTLVRVVTDAQGDFDERTQYVLRDNEMLRNTVRDAAVGFQQAQDNQNRDWDEKWEALREEIDGVKSGIKAKEQAETQAQATITVSRIGRSERVAIAVIAMIGTLLGTLITLLITQAAK